MKGWQEDGNVLVRELHLRDFDEALAFVEQVAARAVDYGRRPDVSIEAGQVRLSIANRHNAGITAAERRLAAKVDAVIDAQ
jgi:4a-hydroxytetrahydrobiopterin dehydratase